jgi:hypothetical protein
VFVIASRGELVALGPPDLQSRSMRLRRGIARQLASQGIPISPVRIYLLATQTHAAPGHDFESHRYSGPFSSPIPGYDQRVVDHFVIGISGAISDAFATLQPACIGFETRRLRGLTFNRAYAAFLRNDRSGAPQLAAQQRSLLEQARTADRLLAAGVPDEKSVEDALPGSDEDRVTNALSGPERAVDDQLFVLRIDSATDGACSATAPPLGVLAVYGMHPTGVPNTNDVYHGDIFGFATRTAAACLQKAYAKRDRPAGSTELAWDLDEDLNPCNGFDGPAQPEPGRIDKAGVPRAVVVGLANGIEGDVSPKLDVQSFSAARELGRRLGISIAQLAAGVNVLSASGSVSSFYRDLRFPSGRYSDAPHDELCPVAELGTSMMSGARDGPTRLKILPEANPGFRKLQPSGCHTYKVPLRVGSGGSEHDYPQVAPIGLILLELAGVRARQRAWLGTLPVEATTMTGFGIREALAQAAKHSPRLAGLDDNLALVGLTNQYLQYVATAPEYDFQLYEGASTLYGPHSAEFLAYQMRCLALDASAPGTSHCAHAEPINAPRQLAFEPSPMVERMPVENELNPLVLRRLPLHQNYRGGSLGWEMEFDRLPLTFTKARSLFRMVLLRGKEGDTELDDDRGSSFELHEHEVGDGVTGRTRWRVRWIPYLGRGDKEPICGQTVRLGVRGRYTFESKPFKVECSPRARAAGSP